MFHVALHGGSDHFAERDSLGTVTFCGKRIVIGDAAWEKIAEGRVIEAAVGCHRCEARRQERRAPVYDPGREREDIDNLYGRRGRRAVLTY
jgi:hypothetical protein